MLSVEATDDPTSAVFERVLTVRRRVYGDEFGFPPDKLSDTLDSYSTHFLCVSGGHDIGVLRLTHGSRGSLEIEDQNPAWKAAVAVSRRQGEAVCECTRFMVVPAARGGDAMLHLLLAAAQCMLDSGCHRGFLAGKEGPLGRLYQMLGAQVQDAELRDYWLGGSLLGRYSLLTISQADARSIVERLTKRCS